MLSSKPGSGATLLPLRLPPTSCAVTAAAAPSSSAASRRLQRMADLCLLAEADEGLLGDRGGLCKRAHCERK